MKKAIVILIFITSLGALAYIVYIRFIKTSGPLACETIDDCVDKKITCREYEQLSCQTSSLATGQKLPEPTCKCFEPGAAY